MHYGSCRKIESAWLLFPLPIVPPRFLFPLSSPPYDTQRPLLKEAC